MYTNYLTHEHFGKLWYTAKLRNWNVMFHSEEENLKAGPLVVLELNDHSINSAGKTVDEAEKNILRLLDHHLRTHTSLPEKYVDKTSWFRKWRMNRLMKKFLCEGTINPVGYKNE